MYKIMIAEDDSVIASVVKKHIESWGYEVKCIEDFQNVLKEFTDFEPHIVLLDLMLPFYNGYHWCNEIRKISSIPIIFISSAADSMNMVMAMNMGGDDFISKPFDLNVLTAKIQAVLRRTYDFSNTAAVIEYKGAILNINDMTLLYNNQKIELTRNEFRILQTLLENKGKTVTRHTLMVRLWESDNYIEENTLTVNINRLRKKLDNIGLKDFILTKTGTGYII
ncbi:MAG: response regulator transcription factor [Acutalibacteraceae bacterium]